MQALGRILLWNSFKYLDIVLSLSLGDLLLNDNAIYRNQSSPKLQVATAYENYRDISKFKDRKEIKLECVYSSYSRNGISYTKGHLFRFRHEKRGLSILATISDILASHFPYQNTPKVDFLRQGGTDWQTSFFATTFTRKLIHKLARDPLQTDPKIAGLALSW